MHFDQQDEYAGFRAEVREFFRHHLPPDIAQRTRIGAHPPPVADYRACQRMLDEQGWGAPHWPTEFGGTGWSALQLHIFSEELYNADVLDYGWQGTRMIGPVIIAFGNSEQQRRFLPPMRSGDEYWCQGFSEPNAGSDLASLRTSARLEGDEWVITGQKIWTSDAQYSDWGFFLVRTDASVKPQQGLSMLLVPMNSAGLRVRPIQSISGGYDLNEVFLEEVRVPAANLVGEAGKGWSYAKYLLDKERTSSAALYQNKRELEKAKEIARAESRYGRPLIELPGFARQVAQVEADLLALEWSVLRILAGERNSNHPDAVVSALKIRGSEMQQRVARLQVEALGARSLRDFGHSVYDPRALLETPDWPAYVPGRMSQYLYQRAATIYGGAREIQKNIIAKRAFGL